jgi:ATP-dependent RNA helicase DDX52/ROK1
VHRGEIKPPVLIFMQSKLRAQELFKELAYDGLNVDVLHSERTAKQRDEVTVFGGLGSRFISIKTRVLCVLCACV